MRWFKHDCDMHTDLKIQSILNKYGPDGYALFNLCLELLGKEGEKGKLEGKLRWKEYLLKVFGWSVDKLDKMLLDMAKLNLICSKALNYGNLYVPNFVKRVDDYTARQLRTISEVTTDKVHLDIDIDQTRIDKNRKEIYMSLLNHWNSKKIIVHKSISEKTCGIINGKLSAGYTIEEIKTAIDNYYHILTGDGYFWNYKWTLQDFLARGFDKFIDLEAAKQNYKIYDKTDKDKVKLDRVKLRKEMFGGDDK